MGTWLIKVFLVLCACNDILTIRTSDKLDFGDTPHQASLIRSEKKLPLKVTRIVDAITSPSEKISVSCGPTGCNTTNNNNNSSVETEVVVHVKTNVNLDKVKDKIDLEDVSDVPIVVGYKGSAPDETPDEEQFRSYPSTTNQNYGISDRSDQFSRNDFNSLRPLYTSVSNAEEYGRHGLYSNSPYGYGSSTFRPSTSGYSKSVYSTTPTTFGYYGPTSSSRIPNSYYEPSTPRSVEINGISSSPLSTTIPELLNRENSIPELLNRGNYDYNNFRQSNGEHHIPYFQHTYNSHYFGEEPPPHVLFNPKSNTYNPVEFRDIPKNKWRPSVFNGRPNKYAFNNEGSNFINPYTHNHNRRIPYTPVVHQRIGEPGCSCREQRTDDHSNPYAAESASHHISVNKDPGATIDDKLAPLN